MDIDEKIDRGASILWYMAIFAGIAMALVGVLWFLDQQGLISVDFNTVCAFALVFLGIGVILFGLWLRSLIKS